MADMSKDAFHIIALDPSRWESYRDLRIQALEESPKAFGMTAEEVKHLDDAGWQAKLIQEGAKLWCAEHNNSLIGMIRAYWSASPAKQHVATIVGLYVIPEWRGKKVASKLLSHILDDLRQDPQFRKVKVEVVATNNAAIKLYESYGFEIIGALYEEFFIDGEYINSLILEQVLE